MTTNSVRIRTAALLGGGVVAGVIGASAFAANAASTTAAATTSSSSSGTSSTSSGSTSSGSTSSGSANSGPGGRANANEKAVSGTKAATLKANALKQAPGATIQTVTTEDPAEGTGAAYEVHLTKSDGSEATLLFKSDLTYLSTEAGGGRGRHGGGGSGETAVTGAKATTLKDAALKQVPGATVDEVTTDSGDAAYEVHLTKSDGTDVTVKFDKNLKFVNVESGRGK